MDLIYKAGKIRAIGVSNYDEKQMTEFRQVAPLHSLQPPYHLLRRDIEETILPYCRNNDIGVLAYGPLGHGLFSGTMDVTTTFPKGDFRANNPLFQGDTFVRALAFVDELKLIADEKGVTAGQLAIAWVLAQPGITVALVGEKRPSQVEQNVQAANVELIKDELLRIEEALKKITDSAIHP
jgi:aryl-alcohol dehydrogenase-like predicted oxidoreductase